MHPPDNTNQKAGKLRQIIRLSKLAFTPVAILFLIIITWQSWDNISHIYKNANKSMLTIAIVSWSILYLLYPVLLVTLLKPWRTRLTFRSILYIHINRLPARYIPGGIWHTVARFTDFRQYGMQKRQLTGLLLLENILSLGLALFLGGAILLFYQEAGLWWYLAFSSAVSGIILIIISIPVINRYILTNDHHISWLTFIRVFIIMSIYWLLAASIFVLYVYALPNIISGQQEVRLGGVYLFSWGVGYLAFFAPQGVGVFEIISGKLLHGNLTLLDTAALIAGFRVIILCADILAWISLRLAYILGKPPQ